MVRAGDRLPTGWWTNRVSVRDPVQFVFMTEVSDMGEMTKVAKANDLAPGKAMSVEVAGRVGQVDDLPFPSGWQRMSSGCEVDGEGR